MKIIIIANCFGLISLILNFSSTQFSQKKHILISNGLANFSSAIQYFLLGALTGTVSCVIATLRNVVFYLYKNKVPLYVFIIYMIIIFAFNIMFLTNWISVIPIITTLVYGFCLFQSNIKLLKGGTIFVDAISIAFDLYNKAYVSMGNCIFSTIGAIIGYVRYIKKEKKKHS